uniref:Uncharacterized protein n=1 Tax=Micrurus carvalhoi TaxID=3147026 RepID=A0A2H6NK55_9SAUR
MAYCGNIPSITKGCKLSSLFQYTFSAPFQHSSTTVPIKEYNFFLIRRNPGLKIRVCLQLEVKQTLGNKLLKLGHEQLSCLNTSVNSKVGMTLGSQTILSSLLHTFPVSKLT